MTALQQSANASTPAEFQFYRGPSRLRKMTRFVRTQPLGTFGGFVILMLILVALLADFIAPYDPTALPGSTFEAPNSTYIFGTDDKGRDIFSRIVYGSQTSLKIGIIATLIGAVGGTLVGLVSGYFGGVVDMAVQRVMDAMLAFPLIILALIMVAILGNSITKLMIVVGIAIVPGVGRVMRGEVLSEKQSLYVEAARSVGASTPRIMLRHILPNVMATVIIIATSLLGAAVLIEASLSFLGLGTAPPTPSWGYDLSANSRRYFERAPWMAIFPGVALSLTVLGFNLLGDALRDVLDPRLRNR